MVDSLDPGALGLDELLSLWTSAVDPLYAQPLLEQGEGHGLEVHTQAHAQLARVSQAIDTTTQALYIRSWSGSTNDPAFGESYATVSLSFSRTGLLTHQMILSKGMLVEEITNDYGPAGSTPIKTGRRFRLLSDLTFEASITGPLTVAAQAENPGLGYSNPLPQTIIGIVQPSSGLNNIGGTVLARTVSSLTLLNRPDVITPDNVGQYVSFTSGTNSGRVALIASYQSPPDLTVPHGGIIGLTTGDDTALSTSSAGTESWKVLDWVNDWGLSVTNAASPGGGSLGMLDALGQERDIRRVPGEGDDAYALRISSPSDVVSPNAILRAANRVLAPLGYQAVLREAGDASFRGVFYDGDPTLTDPAYAFAWDMDRTDALYKVWLDVLEFRAFFLIQVPNALMRPSADAFFDEIAFDTTSSTAAPYDGSPPYMTSDVFLRVYQQVDKARAAGVGFDLVLG